MLTNEESREIGGGLKFCHARVISPPPPSFRVFKRAKKLRFSSLPRATFQRYYVLWEKNLTLDLRDGNWPVWKM